MDKGCSENCDGGYKAREGGALSRPARARRSTVSRIGTSKARLPARSGECSKGRRSITEWKVHLEAYDANAKVTLLLLVVEHAPSPWNSEAVKSRSRMGISNIAFSATH